MRQIIGVNPLAWRRLEPTTANAEDYAKAYAKLPRADRRRLDRQAKRALKRYKGSAK